MESSENPHTSRDFHYHNRFIQIQFGPKKNVCMIHDALVRDNYFPGNISNSGSICRLDNGDQYSYKRMITLPHISLVIGYTLIHFLYTGQFRVLDEQDNSDSAADQQEKLSRQTIEILFAAEMCNLLELFSLSKLEIERLSTSMDFINLLQLVDFVLRSETISNRFESTKESRKWLSLLLRKKLRVLLERDENNFIELPVFSSIRDVALMQEMGTEISRFYFDAILKVRSEISEATEKDSVIERRLERMEKMIQILGDQSVVKNEGKNVCNSERNADNR